MSTPAQLPVHTEHDIQNQLIVQIDSFAAHQRRVSQMFVGIIVLVLALAGVGAYLGLQAYEREASHAQALEQKYEDAQKLFAEQLAAHDAERVANAEQSAALVAQIAARAKQPQAPAVQKALAPTATALEIRSGLQAVLSPRHPDLPPMDIAGETIEISPVSAQALVADEVLLNKVIADLTDTQSLLALANADKASLSSDLAQSQAQNAEAQKVIAAYKKAAVVTKWKKFLNGAQKVGILIVGISLGHTF